MAAAARSRTIRRFVIIKFCPFPAFCGRFLCRFPEPPVPEFSLRLAVVLVLSAAGLVQPAASRHLAT
jgi:hypothetical protein